MENQTTETREQIMEAILFHLAFLTDGQLRMVLGFARGLRKSKKE